MSRNWGVEDIIPSGLFDEAETVTAADVEAALIPPVGIGDLEQPPKKLHISGKSEPWYTLVHGREWNYQKIDLDLVTDGNC